MSIFVFTSAAVALALALTFISTIIHMKYYANSEYAVMITIVH